MKSKLLIIFILLVAFILRIVNIDTNPPALYGDELTIVYDAYSLLKTGHDQTGASYPLTFAMGAGRPAGYVYGSIPFVALFGPTALGVRILSILSGIGIIILLYLLGQRLFNTKVGLAAALIAAFSPWDISLSRGGFEAHLALFFTLAGVVLFMMAEKRPWLYLISAISFGLTLHTYPTYKLTLLPFLFLLIWFIGFKKLVAPNIRKYIISAAVILILIVSLAASQTLTGSSESRFENINVFSQEDLAQNITQKINFERSLSALPLSLPNYFHNKFVEYGKILGENYLQNFSADFLFIHGDRNPRHNMATTGELYLIEIILIFLGIGYLWRKDVKALIFLIGLLVIGPAGTALLTTPHALRSALMLVPLLFISACGLVATTSLRRGLRLFLQSFLLIGFILQFLNFSQKLYFLAPNEYSNFWSYPAKLATEIALENKTNFNYIILSDKIDNVEFAYPVYTKIDPNLVIGQYKNRTSLGKYQFKKFDNVYIGYIPDAEIESFMNSISGSIMFIGSLSQGKFVHNLETIQGKDKSVAIILSKKK